MKIYNFINYNKIGSLTVDIFLFQMSAEDTWRIRLKEDNILLG